MTTLTLSYYPWITQSISGNELAKAIEVFRSLLELEIREVIGNDVRLELLREMEVPDQLDDLRRTPTEVAGKIGLLNPIGYALVHEATRNVQAIAVIRRKIGTSVGPTYKAQIYTHRKTAIRDLKKARGRSMAFGSPQSTSNFLVPAVMLYATGIHPINGFNRVEFTGGHDKAAVAVYEGRLDLGAGHDGAISDLAARYGYGDADQVLINLAWSDPIPSDPVGVNIRDEQLREAVTEALLKVAKPDDDKSSGNEAVYRFWGTREGFERISPEEYAPLLTLMRGLALRPEDLLRKL